MSDQGCLETVGAGPAESLVSGGSWVSGHYTAAVGAGRRCINSPVLAPAEL